uniref:Uncharacterized protein n=1 Tax=Pseudomonas phage Cygsa01 TaxID=3138529 RepID=A0AAU6W3M7_9VIRU
MSEKQFPQVKQAMWQVYQAIGGDLVAVREEAGDTGPIPRAEVIECVLDADRLETMGYITDTAELKSFRNLSWENQVEVAKEVFTTEFYD